MKSILQLIILLTITVTATAQNYSGTVRNNKHLPLAGATISLLKAKDSLILRTALTDEQGKFMIIYNEDIAALLLVSAIGYQPQFASAIKGIEQEIAMTTAPTALKEVVVTARKPLLEIKPGKIVFNVENSINATGSNALELLQKSPGIIVDKDDNIMMNGKNGTRIYIDGKPSPLAGADLAAYLRSINSNDIEAIELIANPSAKFDAEGNAGIVNIRLKKNKNFGWNGTLGGGYAIGVHSNYNGEAGLNFRNSHINFYSSYSAYKNNQESQLNLFRLQNDTTYNQHSISISHPTGQNFKTGIDISLNNKSTLGMVVNGGTSDSRSQSDSYTPIAPASTGTTDKTLAAFGKAHDNRKNVTANLNYRYSDTTGQSLTLDADYGFYHLSRENIVPNFYTDHNDQPISNYTFSNNTLSDINLLSVKGDYERRLKKGKLQAGFKSSLVTTGNTADFFNYDANDKPVYDTSNSNRFVYKEWINAVYGQYERQVKKWNYQVGIRLEQTNSQGQLTSQTTVADKLTKRSYFDFFPSAAINYDLDQKNSFGLSYSRRIDRPRYQDLNPFEYKLDELSYQKGNPFLRPQYTNSFELRHTYMYKLTTAFSYSHIHDYFAQVSDTIEGNRSYIMQRNLNTQQVFSLNISYPFNITAWWSVFANVNLYHTSYSARFEQDKQINLKANVASIYQQQTFRLGKGWTAELSGFYNSPSIWSGTYKTRAIWDLDAGLQKKCWKDNAVFKATVTDIFFTMPWRGVSQFGGLNIIASGQWESRQLKCSFTYRFGNKQVKAAGKRTTGLDELNDRAR